MDILFLSQLLPFPLDSGAKVRAWYTLKWLSRRHRISLLSFAREEDSAASRDALRAVCSSVMTVPLPRSRWRDGVSLLRSLAGGMPALLGRDWRRSMLRAVGRVADTVQPDAVHADQIWMAPYALYCKRRRPGCRIVLDQHNAMFQLLFDLARNERRPLRRLLLRHEAARMERFERFAVEHFDWVAWVSASDRDLLMKEIDRRERSCVIPIGVEVRRAPLPVSSSPFRVTFMGSFKWPSNVEAATWLALEVWPAVRLFRPDLVLTLIGRDPPGALQSLAGAGPAVELHGYVESPVPLLEETAAFVTPLRSGSGMRVKILDAWNWGLPVISTTIGAHGIKTSPGLDIMLADDPRQFAEAIATVAGNPELAGRLRSAGRSAVARLYSWEALYPAWELAYPEEAGKAGLP